MAQRSGKIEKKPGTLDTKSNVLPRLLPLKKASEYLGLSEWALRERIWDGLIPVVRFPGGRKMFIDVRDIEDFIERNKEIVR